MPSRDDLNGTRRVTGIAGHYESWFQRANHPTRPLAFWIRYTMFVPADPARPAIGELWCIVFDGETNAISVQKSEMPISQCHFAASGLDVAIGDATLTADSLDGAIGETCWSLTYTSPHPPLFLLPERFYAAAFPKAKALVGSPLAVFNGSITVGDRKITVCDWVGSQNHNWGSKHTDKYAWGQVAGFDDDPEAFLECGTGRLRVGPLWTPWFTMLTLRLDGEIYAVGGMLRGARNRATYDYFSWTVDAVAGDARVQCQFSAPPEAFAALRYYNPPGGSKTCLNSKIARCSIVVDRVGKPRRELATASRAAFEILTDDDDHGLPIRC